MESLLENEGLRALIQVTNAVTSHLNLDDVLRAVLSETTKVMEAEAASLILVDEVSGDLLFHHVIGDKADTLKSFRLPAGTGIVGHVIETGNSVVVDDAKSDPRFFREVAELTGFPTRSILCVPMASSDRMWGAIEVLNRIDGRPFTPGDQELCETIGGQAAIAIENAMLHESLLAKERLAAFGTAVAGLAHCVRNVLTSIEGGHFLIEQGLEKDNLGPVRQGWQIVSRNARLMHDLVLDMLSYAKEARPEYQLEDINRLVSDTISGIGSKLGREGVEVAWSPDESLPEVEIDRTAVQRCLLNLVTNAAQAVEGIESARIGVRTRRIDDRSFAIDVTDNGRGIEPENVENIFQPFFTTKGSKGTGLGLPVVKKLIEQHGGIISVDSRPGEGTRFTMTLPVAHGSGTMLPVRERAAPASRPEEPGRPGGTSPPAAQHGGSVDAANSILIIDDDPDVQAILSASLEAVSKYRIDVSADGFDGLEKARRTRPALIVLDLHMPGKDGITTLKEIRALDATAGIPVIVLSGDQKVESLQLDYEAARTHGPQLGMQKPVDPPAFQQAVRSLLDLPESM